VCHTGFDSDNLDRCDLLASLDFNGDDALELVCDGETLDSIGDNLGDPGASWGTLSHGTRDLSLERRDAVQSGDTDLSDPFDPSLEWIAHRQDTFDHLGRPPCADTACTQNFDDVCPLETPLCADFHVFPPYSDENAICSKSGVISCQDSGDGVLHVPAGEEVQFVFRNHRYWGVEFTLIPFDGEAYVRFGQPPFYTVDGNCRLGDGRLRERLFFTRPESTYTVGSGIIDSVTVWFHEPQEL